MRQRLGSFRFVSSPKETLDHCLSCSHGHCCGCAVIIFCWNVWTSERATATFRTNHSIKTSAIYFSPSSPRRGLHAHRSDCTGSCCAGLRIDGIEVRPGGGAVRIITGQAPRPFDQACTIPNSVSTPQKTSGMWPVGSSKPGRRGPNDAGNAPQQCSGLGRRAAPPVDL